MHPEPRETYTDFFIGPYQILEGINHGDKGDVFKAYDPINRRTVVLKRLIKTSENVRNVEFFLNEVRLTTQLSHGAIIKIFAVVEEKDQIYYTMPYIEGETLKVIIRKAREREIAGLPEELDHSVNVLTSHFLKVCQAIAYAYSKGFLNRDIKPSNTIIGPYGDLCVIDWGLVTPVDQVANLPPNELAGTLGYLAPEIASGQPPSILTEIYALGQMLYEILTLRMPFHRGDIDEFYQNFYKESLINPIKVAPNRHIHPTLSRMAMKCLSTRPEERYQSVEEMILELEVFLHRRPGWIPVANPKFYDKDSWEVKEDFLISGYPRATLAILDPPFAENKLEISIQFDETDEGIGFLFGLEEKELSWKDCDWIWLSSDLRKYPTEIRRPPKWCFKKPEIFLNRNKEYRLRIENAREGLRIYVDDHFLFSHANYLPRKGNRIGLYFSEKVQVTRLHVQVAGTSLFENPLTLPDNFLTHQDYALALQEYKKSALTHPEIAYKAIFQAGITLLEASKIEDALKEFYQLKMSADAPLGFLGEVLTYQLTGEVEKEFQTFKRAFETYPRHPLLPMLFQRLADRIKESESEDRNTRYLFILLALLYLPKQNSFLNLNHLMNHLTVELEPLYFIDEAERKSSSIELKCKSFAIQLAFLLGDSQAIDEILTAIMSTNTSPLLLIEQGVMALIELGCFEKASEKIMCISQQFLDVQAIAHLSWIQAAIDIHKEKEIKIPFFEELPWKLSTQQFRPLWHILTEALNRQETELVLRVGNQLRTRYQLAPGYSAQIISAEIWAALLNKDGDFAKKLIESYPEGESKTELFYFLKDCWSSLVEKKPMDLLQVSPEMFLWEKRELYRKCILICHCIGDSKKEKHYRKLEKGTWSSEFDLG